MGEGDTLRCRVATNSSWGEGTRGLATFNSQNGNVRRHFGRGGVILPLLTLVFALAEFGAAVAFMFLRHETLAEANCLLAGEKEEHEP